MLLLVHKFLLEGRSVGELLQVGDQCPDVTFRQGRERVRILDFVGEKNLVIAFYAAAFTGG